MTSLSPRIRRQLARAIMLCGHRADADDAVHEVYLEALLKVGQGRRL